LLPVAIDSLHDHFWFRLPVLHSHDEISVFRQRKQAPRSPPANLSIFQTLKIRKNGFIIDGSHDLQCLAKHFDNPRRIRPLKRPVGSESLKIGVWNLKIHFAYAVGILSSDIADLVQSAIEMCNASFSHSLRIIMRGIQEFCSIAMKQGQFPPSAETTTPERPKTALSIARLGTIAKRRPIRIGCEISADFCNTPPDGFSLLLFSLYNLRHVRCDIVASDDSCPAPSPRASPAHALTSTYRLAVQNTTETTHDGTGVAPTQCTAEIDFGGHQV
jgi:hypothetical protein